jgi:uncharacterized membrane protein YsdA (DUF1294 family)/cold shock CspA family protein
MGQEKGTLVRWDNLKGYGFIQPHLGNGEVFLHIKALPHYQRRPRVGDVLVYARQLDERGRYYTLSAKIKGLAWSRFTLVLAGLAVSLAIYMSLVVRQVLPLHPIAIYAAMSLVTIWAYSHDKQAAQAGEKRTSEKKLHVMEAFGGWPGALLAQFFYRHKSQKISYLLVFYLIVAGHGVLWYLALTHQEEYFFYQQSVVQKIEILNANLKREIQRLLAEEKPLVATSVHTPMKSAEQRVSLAAAGRSIVAPVEGTRVVEGIVTEIRLGEGVVVSIDSRTDGIIHKSTLVRNFSQVFKKGERIQVAVQGITFTGNKSSVELVLVER